MDEPGTPANHHDLPCSPLGDHGLGSSDISVGDHVCQTSTVPDVHEHAARPPRNTLVPFVVQAGQRVFMLAAENHAWVLAELKFDDERVAFFETRRSVYEWPREAFGALMSRVALRVADDAALDEVTVDFGRWLGGQFTAG